MVINMSEYRSIQSINQQNRLFNNTKYTIAKCIDAFENAKIFKNKTIYEIEKDVVVVFG